MGAGKRKAKTRPTIQRFYSPAYQQRVLRQLANQAVQRNVETKHATYSTTDGTEIYHNNFMSLTPNILATTQGVQDPELSNQDCRIGDEIMLKGASIKMMVELNERYSDVTLRLMVIKAAKGDVPTRATLFTGRSGNKMLDIIDKERYSVLFQRFYKLKAPNLSVTNLLGASTQVSDGITNAGIQASNRTDVQLSRSTKIIKVWLPGAKFGNKGKIKYENGSSQVKFFDYHVLLYAYSNITTAQDQWYVARVNDYVQELYYKDA